MTKRIKMMTQHIEKDDLVLYAFCKFTVLPVTSTDISQKTEKLVLSQSVIVKRNCVDIKTR